MSKKPPDSVDDVFASLLTGKKKGAEPPAEPKAEAAPPPAPPPAPPAQAEPPAHTDLVPPPAPAPEPTPAPRAEPAIAATTQAPESNADKHKHEVDQEKLAASMLGIGGAKKVPSGAYKATKYNPETGKELPEPDAGDDGDDDVKPPKKGIPTGALMLGVFGVVIIGIIVTIATNPEYLARFQCQALGNKTKCVTEDDKLFDIDQRKLKEEDELMRNHYGSFDLNYSPPDKTTWTLKRVRYEEKRDDYISRIKKGGADQRVRKDEKELKTFAPVVGKELVLPVPFQNLPVLEREQEVKGKRITQEEISKRDKDKKDREDRGEKGEEEVQTVAMSSYVYTLEMIAPEFKPRKVALYEEPPPADIKKLEEQGWVLKKFTRTPDGRFIAENTSWDLPPTPQGIRGRYLAFLKEKKCLEQAPDFKAKSDKAKEDEIQLLWEQKAFTSELKATALENEKDPEWIKDKEKFLGEHQCPKAAK